MGAGAQTGLMAQPGRCLQSLWWPSLLIYILHLCGLFTFVLDQHASRHAELKWQRFFPLQQLQPTGWTSWSSTPWASSTGVPVAEGQQAADRCLENASSSLHVPGFSLLPDVLAGECDTVTRSTGALTCLWHLPKRINQSHSAAALEESPPCTLPGSVGLQTNRTNTVW